MRIETEIGAVLMPGDVSAILATFGEDRSAEQEDVRTDQVFERVENARAAGDFDQKRHGQMALDLETAVGAFAHPGLIGDDLRRAIGRLRGIERAQRSEPALFAKMTDLRVG